MSWHTLKHNALRQLDENLRKAREVNIPNHTTFDNFLPISPTIVNTVIEEISETMLRVIKTRVEPKDRRLVGEVNWDINEQKLKVFTSEEMWEEVTMLGQDLVDQGITPCSKCGMEPAQDCGYLSYDSWNGEYDCDDPDNDGELCDYCKHTFCQLCKLKEKHNFKEEEFEIV